MLHQIDEGFKHSMAPVDDLPPFTPEELSDYLWDHHRIRRSTTRLARLRQIGGGPPFYRDGVYARYPQRSAAEWARALLGKPVSSTAEESSSRCHAAFGSPSQP